MLNAIFAQDVELQDWEAMLALMRGDNLDDLKEGLKADAWEKSRGYEYEHVPPLGDTYATILLDAHKGEIVDQVGANNLWLLAQVDGKQTRFLVDNKDVNNLDDYNNYLAEVTGLNQLEAFIDELMTNYNHDDSEILTALAREGKDCLIGDYEPTAKNLIDMGIGINLERMAQPLKWALGAARIIEAFINENMIDELKPVFVDIGMYGIRVNVNILKDGIDELADYSNLYSLMKLERLAS